MHGTALSVSAYAANLAPLPVTLTATIVNPPTAEHVLSTIHTKTLFFSVAGIHEGEMYNQNLLLVQAERRMMEQAQRVVLLADSSKFDQQALARLGSLSEVDVVVSDSEISEEHDGLPVALRNGHERLD